MQNCSILQFSYLFKLLNVRRCWYILQGNSSLTVDCFIMHFLCIQLLTSLPSQIRRRETYHKGVRGIYKNRYAIAKYCERYIKRRQYLRSIVKPARVSALNVEKLSSGAFTLQLQARWAYSANNNKCLHCGYQYQIILW